MDIAIHIITAQYFPRYNHMFLDFPVIHSNKRFHEKYSNIKHTSSYSWSKWYVQYFIGKQTINNVSLALDL